MKFLVDAQLPRALARMLTDDGHDALHVSDIGLTAASDSEIWNEAGRRGSVIISKDEDFILLSRKCKESEAPAVVWIRMGNCTRQALLAAFRSVLPDLLTLLAAGEAIVEVR